MIRIIIDSTSDFTPEVRKKFDLEMLPLTIHFGTDSFLDSIDLDSKSFYHKLRQAKALPTTSQVPP
ncbi:MAG: DegV family protein, partial [Clostridiales bacterium]|nr:DegV family protein [Clostridiales bacterium]